MDVVIRLVATAALLLITAVAWADDTDIFFPASSATGASANVLLVVDNTRSWLNRDASGKPVLAALQSALAEVLRNLQDESVHVGLLLYTQQATEGEDDAGAYVRSALRPMNAQNRELYARQVESLDGELDSGGSGRAALGFAEAWSYFSEGVAASGRGRAKADYSGKPGWVDAATGLRACTEGERESASRDCVWTGPGSAADAAVWALQGNALQAEDSVSYHRSQNDAVCGANAIIFISFGPNEDSAAATRRARELLREAGGETTPIDLPGGDGAAGFADEWSRFLAASELGITTYSIEVSPGETDQESVWSAMLQSMAAVSSGRYFAADASSDSIRSALDRALAQVISVDTTFVPVALPASAFLRGTFRNQVYMAQFRPDELARPRWQGNLKQYRMGVARDAGETVLRLLDADNQPAIDSTSGQIQDCARSFWTPEQQDGYWRHLASEEQRSDCTAITGYRASNTPDGAVVEKGGQAYIGRGAAAYASALARSRVIGTAAAEFCGGNTGRTCTMTDFSTGNPALTTAVLGAAQDSERTRLIDWARGADTEDEDGDGDTREFRPSLHGDVIHSQPLAIDYAVDTAEPKVVVFYGGNDGLLRAVNGNRSLAQSGPGLGAGVPAGGEFWAFMPTEYHSQIKAALRNHTPATRDNRRKIYGPDGPLTAWQSESGQRFLVMAMRRGGRSVYGLDITDPSSPQLLWRLGCSGPPGDGQVCAHGWGAIGQTWSPIQVAWQQATQAPLLIMGGGYDSCEDEEVPDLGANHRCNADTSGNGIYVLNAATGALLASFATERAVPGRVTLVSADEDARSLNYAYAADTGGNLYRLSGPSGEPIGQATPENWVLTRIADLGCGGKSDADCGANRKFLFGPDVVRIPGSARYAVLIGSGDREKPLASYTVTRAVDNAFFAIVDAPTEPDWLGSAVSACNEATLCADALTTVALDQPVQASSTMSEKGWWMKLHAGEQVVSAALTIADKIYFNTHRPSDAQTGTCGNGLGVATLYQLDYRDGTGQATQVPTGGLLPTPVAGKVVLDDASVVPFCIGCNAGRSAIGRDAMALPTPRSRPKIRVYRRIDQ